MTKDDPSDIIEDYFAETAYQNQPYGRSILGPEKNIKKFTKDDIISYVKNQYKTEDMIISFAGKLKTEDAVKFTEKYFNNLQNGKNKDPEKAIYTGGSFTKNKKLEQTQLMLGFEGYSYLNEHFYEAGVLGIILGGGMSSKLFQNIREKKGLCYRIDACATGSEDTGIFEIACATAPEKANEAISAIMDELKNTTNNITEEECNRAIIKLKSAILMSKESNSSRAKKNVSDLFSMNRLVSSEEIISKIEEINTKKLKCLMEKILEKSNPTLALLGKLDKSTLNLKI